MAEINKEVMVDAGLETIFAFVSKPGNLPEIWPNLVAIRNEITMPNGGYSFEWEYKVYGMLLKGTGEYTDIVPNHFFMVTIKGNLQSTITWTFRYMESKTRVTFTLEYQPPLPILNRIGNKIIENIKAHEADLILANLQSRFMDTKI